MKTELRLALKESSSDTMSKPLNMFLDSWLEGVCQDRYLLTDNTVVFDYPEDAIVAKLMDIPPALSPYVGFADA